MVCVCVVCILTRVVQVHNVLGDVRETYAKLDISHNGLLEREEMRQVLLALGVHPTEKQLDEVYDAVDADKSGVISFSEFEQWYYSSGFRYEAQMQAAFEKCGFADEFALTSENLRALLEASMQLTVSDEELAVVGPGVGGLGAQHSCCCCYLSVSVCVCLSLCVLSHLCRLSRSLSLCVGVSLISLCLSHLSLCLSVPPSFLPCCDAPCRLDAHTFHAHTVVTSRGYRDADCRRH